MSNCLGTSGPLCQKFAGEFFPCSMSPVITAAAATPPITPAAMVPPLPDPCGCRPGLVSALCPPFADGCREAGISG